VVDSPVAGSSAASVEVGELITCLNCGADLHGRFCGACGQRVVPPHPSVRELAGDAWHELTGYDGRIMATIHGLARPGFLTREYIEGRRAHYLSPVRIYLFVSVIYFVIAASVPEDMAIREDGSMAGPGGVQIITETGDGAPMSAEERAELLTQADTAPWYVRPLYRALAEDRSGFRDRMFTIMPRVFFALLPVFAGVVALFYRKRHFPTALVFAVHLHAFAFIVFAVAELMKFTRNEHLADRVNGVIAVIFAIYALRAFRAVFGGSWPMTMVKAMSIGFLYLIAAIPAFIVIMLWAAWV
jgi:hypothetical protein